MSSEVTSTRHDRPRPRLLGDPAQLGALESALRGEGLQGDRPGVPRLRGRGRGAQRRPDADRRRDRPGDHRPPRGRHQRLRDRRRSSSATRPAARSRRSCSTTATAPRRRDQLGADRGRPGHAAVADQVDVPGAEEPGQPPQGGRLHPRAVAVRVHQHLHRRARRASCTSATTSPRRAASCWGSVLANFQPGHQDTWVDYHNEQPRAAAVHLRQRGPPDAAGDPAVEPEALQVREHDHRDQRVRGSAPAAGRRQDWEEIADYALDWAVEHAVTSAPAVAEADAAS